MKDYDDFLAALEAMDKLSPKYKQEVMKVLLYREEIDIPQLISVYSNYLTQYKHNASNDIRKISQAGLSLLGKQFKKIKQIKSYQTRNLHYAFAYTILSGGGYFGSKAHKELLDEIDMSGVDMEWYNECWKLETQNVLNKEALND